MTPVVSRPVMIAGLVALLGGGAVYWHHRDPAPAIFEELHAASIDADNHSAYADLLRDEKAHQWHLSTATFATPCFWSGEARFGLMDGVYATTPGYLDGHEVVRVDYDPAAVTYDALEAQADPNQALEASHEAACKFNAAASKTSRDDKAFHPDGQPKWYLQQTDLQSIPMTAMQAMRINAYLHARRPIEPLLSPGQRSLWERSRQQP